MTRQRRDPDVPVLFLDFDGVLHPDEVYRVRDKIVLKMDGFCLFEWASLLEEILAPYPSLSIVLSTSWARVLGVGVARSWLAEGLRRRVGSGSGTGHHLCSLSPSQSRWSQRYRTQGLTRSGVTLTIRLYV